MAAEMENKCSQIITELFAKYENSENSEYMLQRIYNHIVNYLPNTLEYELKNREKRINRNMFLTNEQQIFIQVFLNKNQYYYLPHNNLFYEYNGKNYTIVKEDDIIHKLLSNISKDRVLLSWKYKTKLNIIKQIKERSLFNSIPETDTIQNVLNSLYPYIFTSKNSAKYFLTIIGDNILKKNTQLVFLITPSLKKILNEIDYIAFLSIGITSATHNFVVKYHENHSYENCRLIKINEHYSNPIFKDILKKIGLDLLCVASHYSKRYENSDKFIDYKLDEDLKTYTNYIKNKTQKEIVEEFCLTYIIESGSKTDTIVNLEWKNLHFLWKQFLSQFQLPNMIYSNSLKNLLKEKYIYNEITETFQGITSKFLPMQHDFIKFWETNISTVDSEDSFDSEFEIDELCSLFKLWAKNTDVTLTNGNISEENMLKILGHFFPTVEIIENKYILNIYCLLWDKIKDIDQSFEYIKNQIKKECKLALISFDEAYNYYYKYCNMNSYKFIVSKRYFEKYLYLKLSEHIVYEKFIETSWIV
jgi:hypothetical protein